MEVGFVPIVISVESLTVGVDEVFRVGLTILTTYVTVFIRRTSRKDPRNQSECPDLIYPDPE